MVISLSFFQYNKNFINNQDPQSKIEHDERPGAEYPNKDDSGGTETKKLRQFPTFCPEYYQMIKLRKA